MTKHRRAIAFVVVLAVVAAVSAIIVANDDPDTPDRIRIQRSPYGCGHSFHDDDLINYVSIRTGAQEQTWVRDDNRRWYFDTTDGDPVDPAIWRGVTLLLWGPQHCRELAVAVAHLDRYGLASPETVIRIGMESVGIRWEVRLGDRTPDGGEHYAQKDDDPAVYLIDSNWGDALTKLVREPPHQILWSADSVVKAVSVEHQGNRQLWAVDDEGIWRFDSSKGDPVDVERWESVLDLLTDTRFRYETEGPPVSLEPYGLDEPVTVVRFYFKNYGPAEVRLGGQTPDGARQYARINGSNPVILIDRGWGDTFANLILNPPIAPPAEDSDDSGEACRKGPGPGGPASSPVGRRLR